MKEEISILVHKENIGQRLDRFLHFVFNEAKDSFGHFLADNTSISVAGKLYGFTRSKFQKLLQGGNVCVNEKIILSKNYKVHMNDKISLSVPRQENLAAEAEDIPLEVVYEDDDLVVVNKPQGMVVHPAAGHQCGTLVNALKFHFRDSLSRISGESRLGIVHRIDKGTSGLLIVAKNDRAHIKLAQQIKEHSFLREYEAVIHGNLKKDSGKIAAPIGRDPNNRKKMCVIGRNSRWAITHFEVIKNFKGFAHISLRLETGRTHQIRVHMSSIGHPVVGDPVYGPRKKLYEALNNQCLHAKTIGFEHPETGEYIHLTSALPKAFEALLDQIKSPDSS
ncbi:MAG: RluA family pseudouridine synthase [Oscillospiraceae bacterium]|jgi:23S rRNA pseudouridine1911/1915/1917 synthase|nr:RluA family pseudouridine synthase [Oscillospiraceae bacterium]